MAQNQDNQDNEICPTCRRCHTEGVTKEQIEMIADKAAIKATVLMRDNLARGVGFKVLNTLALMIGLSIVGVFFWLASLGLVKH